MATRQHRQRRALGCRPEVLPALALRDSPAFLALESLQRVEDGVALVASVL
jgi:hypothetical protein